jgi:hypothetical protein
MGSRRCVEYCLKSGAEGPKDPYMYSREHTLPNCSMKMLTNREMFSYKPIGRPFCSFYEMMRFMRVTKTMSRSASRA